MPIPEPRDASHHIERDAGVTSNSVAFPATIRASGLAAVDPWRGARVSVLKSINDLLPAVKGVPPGQPATSSPSSGGRIP